MKNIEVLACLLSVIFVSMSALADEQDNGDIHVNNYAHTAKSASNFTVLDADHYRQTVQESRAKISEILLAQQKQHFKNADARMAFLTQRLQDIPYTFSGAAGEGDWDGKAHIKQDPVYRLDGLNCQTFTQVVLAMYFSKDIDEFDKNILKINYGSAGNPQGEIVHFFNRNHFIDGDWNPNNQQNGFITDCTAYGNLSSCSKMTYANITRQNWFDLQQSDLQRTVRVLNPADGPAMADRYAHFYAKLNFPHFDFQTVGLSYIPKEKIAALQTDGHYKPNIDLLDKIPTPAVVEIVRDAKKWQIDGKNIKEVIGSELSVSHMGVLYHQNFKRGEIIYQKNECKYNDQHEKICDVSPITCQKKLCKVLMFSHPTAARPNGYFWYQSSKNRYACSAELPDGITQYTQCNRVQAIPLFDYLTDYQYESHLYMTNPSILGIHVEHITR